jgi:hypothetical protein
MKRSKSQIHATVILILICFVVAGRTYGAALKDIDTVHAMLEDWRKAWESKDVDRFMAFYSSRFRSDGLDYDAWKIRKERIFDIRGEIAVKLIDPWVLIEGDRASIRFIQQYQGPTGTDAGEKTMDLHRSAGTWQILSENWNPISYPAPMPDRNEQQTPQPETVEPEPIENTEPEEPEPIENTVTAEHSTGNEKTRYLVGTGVGASHVQYDTAMGSEGVSIEFSSFSIPIFFTIEGERPRIVIDVRDVSAWQGPAKIPINGKHIRQIRSFLHHHDQRLRIVLDLYPHRDYMIDQIYDIDRNIYRIGVETVE